MLAVTLRALLFGAATATQVPILVIVRHTDRYYITVLTPPHPTNAVLLQLLHHAVDAVADFLNFTHTSFSIPCTFLQQLLHVLTNPTSNSDLDPAPTSAPLPLKPS
uniref:Secreted protein n=1 Tax=Lygus hesperus TaxID=30085 RepID=A0A146L511_LYGHE